MHLRQQTFPVWSRGGELLEEGFYQRPQQLEISLFQDMNCYMIKTLRNMYRDILDDLGVTNPDSYTSFKLKSNLLNNFGNRVAILDQSGQASGFICAASVPLGDALAKLKQLEHICNPILILNRKPYLEQQKILREDEKLCRKKRLAWNPLMYLTN